MQVGDIVQVLPPFKESFPDTYQIEAITEFGDFVICGDRQFAAIHLEKI